MARPGSLAWLDDYVNNSKSSPHEAFDPILKKTHNVCLYQEQMTQMSTVLGFSLDEAETLRKIVGKKLTHKVKEWKDKIYQKAEENGFDKGIGDILWKILDDSSKYSFNKCLSPDTLVETESGDKMLFEVQHGDKVRAFDVRGRKDHYVNVTAKYESEAEIYQVELEDGRIIRCSMDHKFLTENNGMVPLKDILDKNLKIITD